MILAYLTEDLALWFYGSGADSGAALFMGSFGRLLMMLLGVMSATIAMVRGGGSI